MVRGLNTRRLSSSKCRLQLSKEGSTHEATETAALLTSGPRGEVEGIGVGGVARLNNVKPVIGES